MTGDKNMPEARFIVPDGSEKIVQPSGYELRPDNIRFDAEKHAGHIKCMCCNADMRLQEGKSIAGGSSARGRNAYFTPVKKHDDDCIRRLWVPSPWTQKIDRTKGWRIHIDTRQFSADFNKLSGVYEVSPFGNIIRINDDALRDREVYVLKTAQDAIDLMRKGDPKRLKNSKVIFNNQVEDWLDFCAPLSRPHRYGRLVERAIAAKDNEDALPFALMGVKMTKGYVSGRAEVSKDTFTMPAERIQYGRDDRGKKREIEPSAAVHGRIHSEALKGIPAKGGEFFLMGVVRHKTFEGDFKTIEYLNVTVDHPGQYVKIDTETLEKEARVAAEARRGNHRKPAPSSP